MLADLTFRNQEYFGRGSFYYRLRLCGSFLFIKFSFIRIAISKFAERAGVSLIQQQYIEAIAPIVFFAYRPRIEDSVRIVSSLLSVVCLVTLIFFLSQETSKKLALAEFILSSFSLQFVLSFHFQKCIMSGFINLLTAEKTVKNKAVLDTILFMVFFNQISRIIFYFMKNSCEFNIVIRDFCFLFLFSTLCYWFVLDHFRNTYLVDSKKRWSFDFKSFFSFELWAKSPKGTIVLNKGLSFIIWTFILFAFFYFSSFYMNMLTIDILDILSKIYVLLSSPLAFICFFFDLFIVNKSLDGIYYFYLEVSLVVVLWVMFYIVDYIVNLQLFVTLKVLLILALFIIDRRVMEILFIIDHYFITVPFVFMYLLPQMNYKSRKKRREYYLQLRIFFGTMYLTNGNGLINEQIPLFKG